MGHKVTYQRQFEDVEDPPCFLFPDTKDFGEAAAKAQRELDRMGLEGCRIVKIEAWE